VEQQGGPRRSSLTIPPSSPQDLQADQRRRFSLFDRNTDGQQNPSQYFNRYGSGLLLGARDEQGKLHSSTLRKRVMSPKLQRFLQSGWRLRQFARVVKYTQNGYWKVAIYMLIVATFVVPVIAFLHFVALPEDH
jgi:hypothetical protein